MRLLRLKFVRNEVSSKAIALCYRIGIVTDSRNAFGALQRAPPRPGGRPAGVTDSVEYYMTRPKSSGAFSAHSIASNDAILKHYRLVLCYA
ncbi:hypothetical protein EVAR_64886_1 [Eumeta japonica]|uniref:Uncharacterized protein n=1 Tax=Eumeta variegata TaxID=151549 RepID=A0A4C1ZXM4_EUMVA|nr:hypothetical protein EVAR_64886_1 [Eumeta japonica]